MFGWNDATANKGPNPQQIEVEWEHYGRRTCSKLHVCVRTSAVQPRRGDRRKCGQQARSSMSFDDNTIVAKSSDLGTQFHAKYADFGDNWLSF